MMPRASRRRWCAGSSVSTKRTSSRYLCTLNGAEWIHEHLTQTGFEGREVGGDTGVPPRRRAADGGHPLRAPPRRVLVGAEGEASLPCGVGARRPRTDRGDRLVEGE